MKKVYLIHCWGGHPNEHFYPWIKKELQNKGFEVIQPQMPGTDYPKIEEWVSFLSNLVQNPDKETFFIGHSIGCQTIMRYLQTLNTPVGGAVFVAGWFDLDNLETQEEKDISNPWVETLIDFEKIKNICPKISVFLSDNEPFGFVEENKKIFEEKLDAKVFVMEKRGHFFENDGVTKFPEALKALEEMMK